MTFHEACDAARQPLLVENAMKCKLCVMTRIMACLADGAARHPLGR
jgi:hypothetical protein